MLFEDIYQYISKTKLERQSHLKLDESCIEIGGNSEQFRALLAHYLKTTIPKGMKIYCCHACHNGKCSNPTHLYWGTAKENNQDAADNGKISIYEATIRKHGEEGALKMWKKVHFKRGNTMKRDSMGKFRSRSSVERT